MSRTRLVGVLALSLLAAACSKDPKTADKATTGTDTAVEKTATPDVPTGSVEERLARVEKKVDKVISVLNELLGPAKPDPKKTYSVAVDPRDPVEGPADAKVTIIEGFEFACPYCWQAAPMMEQLRTDYPKDVRIVNKYLVVHAPAVPSGLALCAANKQGKFTEMKKMVWAKAWTSEGQMVQDQLSPDAMLANATELGLDGAKFKADMESEDCQDWLRDSEETLKKAGQSGTPGFFVNGRAVPGLIPVGQMKALIGEELEKANKAIAAGVKPAEYYEKEIVAKGESKLGGWFDIE